jgi:hypothetical protein
MRIYNLEARIEEAKRRDLWTCSYIEAHIWDPDIQLKAEGGVAMHPWSVPTKKLPTSMAAASPALPHPLEAPLSPGQLDVRSGY